MNLPKLKNSKLFAEAFTHRSYLNEAKLKIASNERLEFLGDSIISFVISNYLYTKYPDFNEGDLTNLRSLMVNTKSLSEIARELNMGTLLKLSRGEEESKGRENATLLENSFEAYCGALFLDQGMDSVVKFLNNVLFPKIQALVAKKAFKDPKSLLQEKVQAEKQGSPQYRVLGESGPAHAKIFKVAVFVDGKKLGEGTGKSKQIAEVSAAQRALEGKAKNDIILFMSVVIRLAKTGKRGEGRYRVVVTEKRYRRDGEPIETLGWYEKREKGKEDKVISKDRYDYWITKGAKPSPTVEKIINK